MYGRRWPGGLKVLVLVGLIVLLVRLIDISITPSLVEIARARAQLEGVRSINSAINTRVVNEIEYQDLICVHKDDRGQIVLIQPNTVKINRLMARTVLEVEDSLEKLGERAFDIPLGQAFGSSFLAGYGPKIRVRMFPVGTVDVNVINKFESAGINQTRHLIYLKITSKMKIAVPFVDQEVRVATTVPVAENIVIGTVPETYVNLSNQALPLYPALQPKSH